MQRVISYYFTNWQQSVLDKDILTPPANPVSGDRYLIYGTGTGVWSGKDNCIAFWNGSIWEFIEPKAGMVVFVMDENNYYRYRNFAWGKVIIGETARDFWHSNAVLSSKDGIIMPVITDVSSFNEVIY